MSDWTSVKKRLPEREGIDNKVLVTDGEAIDVAYISIHGEWIGPVWWENITHWLPYPPPPNIKAGNDG